MRKDMSDVVEAMRQSKDAAWEAYWAHSTGPKRADREEGDRLWQAYEHAAIVFCGEVEARERLGGLPRVAA